jgi:hypothetical protein
MVVDPSTFDPWPDFYMDQNGDGNITANDALRVINDFARRGLPEPEFELVAALRDQLARVESWSEPRDEFPGDTPTQDAPPKVSQFTFLNPSGETRGLVDDTAVKSSTAPQTAIDPAQVDELLSSREWF